MAIKGYSRVCCHVCGRWWSSVHDVPVGGRIGYHCNGYAESAHPPAYAYCVAIDKLHERAIQAPETHEQTAHYHALAKLMHASYSRE